MHYFTKAELGGIQCAELPKSSKCVIPKENNSKREPHKNLCKFLEIRHNSPRYFKKSYNVSKFVGFQSFILT